VRAAWRLRTIGRDSGSPQALISRQVRRYYLYEDYRLLQGPGQEFDVERLGRGDYRLIRRTASRNNGAIEWLLACPQKGVFVPIDSESTETL
jgi:hypothetical protein